MWMAVFETKVTFQCKSLANMQIDLPACSLWTTELFSVYKPMNICSNPPFANLMGIQYISVHFWIIFVTELNHKFEMERYTILSWVLHSVLISGPIHTLQLLSGNKYLCQKAFVANLVQTIGLTNFMCRWFVLHLAIFVVLPKHNYMFSCFPLMWINGPLYWQARPR